MFCIEATIQNEHGIHCRPTALIIKSIGDYSGTIVVRCETGEANPRSMLNLMSLGLAQGTQIVIAVDGPDEEAMAIRLRDMFETNFDFPRE
ncbi:MAG TPA: HPr family phosphocarrier protein [Kiritimatiellia bacterium]|nr:HPr family phosphocarrier protein [Kiritimatiellia bacterium]